MSKNRTRLMSTLILVAGMFVSIVFSHGCYSCVPDSWQVETARKQIPVAIEFIGDNKEFLDMLLDIQERVRSFNEQMQIGLNSSEDTLIGRYMMTLYKEDLAIFMTLGEYSSASRSVQVGSEYDILTYNEKQLIKDKLLEMMLDERTMTINIFLEKVSLSFYRYQRATIYIESPAEEFEDQDGDSYLTYYYAEKVNHDWCVYLEKAGYD